MIFAINDQVYSFINWEKCLNKFEVLKLENYFWLDYIFSYILIIWS